jgi:hypothetical protein
MKMDLDINWVHKLNYYKTYIRYTKYRKFDVEKGHKRTYNPHHQLYLRRLSLQSMALQQSWSRKKCTKIK